MDRQGNPWGVMLAASFVVIFLLLALAVANVAVPAFVRLVTGS